MTMKTITIMNITITSMTIRITETTTPPPPTATTTPPTTATTTTTNYSTVTTTKFQGFDCVRCIGSLARHRCCHCCLLCFEKSMKTAIVSMLTMKTNNKSSVVEIYIHMYYYIIIYIYIYYCCCFNVFELIPTLLL